MLTARDRSRRIFAPQGDPDPAAVSVMRSHRRHDNPKGTRSAAHTRAPKNERNPVFAEQSLDRMMAAAMRHFVSGELAQAHPLLRRICERAPDDAESRIKLAMVERRLGLLDSAEKEARRAMRRAPRHFLAHQTLGLILHGKGNPVAAAKCYADAIRLQPRFPDTHYLLGLAENDRGRLKPAEKAFRAALALRAEYPEALVGLAGLLLLRSEHDEAEALLQAALTLSPELPEALANMGSVRERQRRPDEALAFHRRAAERAPDRLDILAEYGAVLEKQGKWEEAKASLAGRAGTQGHPSAALVLARVARREGDAAGALAILAAARPQASTYQAIEMDLLAGQLHDVLHEPDRAFSLVVAAKRARAQAQGIAPGAPPPLIEDVEQSRRMLGRWVSESAAPEDSAAPIFLIGFPRSGTTLLEHLLDSHPSIQSMEERPIVSAMRNIIDQWPAANAPIRLSVDQREQLQRCYWDQVERELGPRDGRILLDKLPLNTVWAHLIRQVFPGARFLFAVRHPLDVCLSCFMHDFSMNQAMTSFLTLRGTAVTYAAVMQLWFDQLGAMAIPHHVIRYEDLIEDPEAAGQAMLNGLGLDGGDVTLDHLASVQRKAIIKTPSYHQVARPLYRDALARWKRYERQLEPIREIVAPFVERFGYND
jgi:tetratricopeptide (TPR) repeat protein